MKIGFRISVGSMPMLHKVYISNAATIRIYAIRVCTSYP
jgi:hypothetical protein